MNNSTGQQQDQPNISNIEKYIILSFFLATFVIGLVGNILVLVIVAKRRVKRTANDVFIMNLAVSDLTMIFFLPLQISELFGTFPGNVFTCNFVRPLMTVTFFVSIFTLTTMAVYRCKVILNPLRPEIKELFAILLVVLVWIISFACVLPLMVVNQPTGSPLPCQEFWPSNTYRKTYTVALVILQYILPLLIIAVAYMRIGLDLYRARLPTRLSFKRKSSAKDEGICKVNYKARKRENLQVIKTLATIVIMFAICLLPGQVAWLLADFGDISLQSLNIWINVGLVMSVFHSCLNPLIYGTLTRQFRRGYVKYLSYLLCCCESSRFVQRLRMLRVDSTRTDSRKRTSFGYHNDRTNAATTSTTASSVVRKPPSCFSRYLRLGSSSSVKNGNIGDLNSNGGLQGETIV